MQYVHTLRTSQNMQCANVILIMIFFFQYALIGSG